MTEHDLAGRVLAALLRAGLVPDDPGWRVVLAGSGSTGRTFSIVDPAGTPGLTARLARAGHGELLRHEEQVLRELATEQGHQWSPRQVTRLDDDSLPGGQLLIHEHLPGEPRPLASLSGTAHAALGRCLAELHRHRREGYMLWPSLGTRHGTRADLFHQRVDTLSRYQSQHLLPEAQRLIGQMSTQPLDPSAGWHEPGFALLHGDLSLGNILWDDDAASLIDWEYTRDGDSAEDIAYLVAEQQLPHGIFSDIADAYMEHGGDPWALARVPTWLPLVTLDAALWWADHALSAGIDPTVDGNVRERLARLHMG